MGHSSNQVPDDNGDCSNLGYNNRCQTSPFTTASSFPPLLPDKRSYWKRVSFGRFSSQPIGLSVLKLDGSTFDIIVTKKATVAKLKQAVEDAFSHLHTQGDCWISWPHVWGNFCLCFEHMKLLRDRDPIARYGIKNGDQLQFVRHTPIYTIAGETSVENSCGPDDCEGSSSTSYLCGDMKKKQNLVKNEVSEGYKDYGASKKYTMRGLLSDRRQEGPTKRNYRVVRLGRPLPCDDENSNKRKEISCRLDTYSCGSFCDYVGGFGYPTGYCLK
ncbi:putative U11/U12 small nuclear ribonucleoprotein 25kDa protein [Helianthus annuus]|nr:putative U11/U12 small nuclear ribonucleoprotein 25kDa protein [Helianthus annuus]KAJ0858245.1 putative U11/U12 small nuclear ribonucleoprotein 25kDa protein [Helianthus annuus]